MKDGIDQPMILLADVRLNLASAGGEVNVLRGVSLRIAVGERVALVGPSGSGKSTLIMVIGGLERPSGGRVTIAGSDLTPLDEDGLAALRRRKIGIVFQSFHLLPAMTALENVALPLELAGRDNAFSIRRRDGRAGDRSAPPAGNRARDDTPPRHARY